MKVNRQLCRPSLYRFKHVIHYVVMNESSACKIDVKRSTKLLREATQILTEVIEEETVDTSVHVPQVGDKEEFFTCDRCLSEIWNRR
jgi:hypothetical protein